MTKLEYTKKYNKLCNQAMKLPKQQALLKLKKASELKAYYFLSLNNTKDKE